MSQSNPPSTISAELVDKIMQGVGLCIFQCQQIEAYLKFLLPHMRRPGAQAQASLREFSWRELIDSKTTLGSLAKLLQERSSAEEPAHLSGLLDRLVSERNHLVHHMFTDPEHPLRTNADAERVIGTLRDRASRAAAVAQAVRTAAGQFANLLDQESSGQAISVELELRLRRNVS